MEEYAPAVILDNGSGLIKIGFSGEKEPRFVYTNIIGRPKAKPVMIGAGQKDFYVGEEAQARRGILSISYPVEHGVVTSWEDMELIWKYVYYHDLKINSCERPVLVTEPPLNPLSNREKTVEIFLEELSAPAIYVAIQAALALYCCGRITGCVVDIGDGVTHTVPIYQGYCLPHAVLRLDLAGRDLTDYLMRILNESGISLISTAEREIVKEIKEKLCYVAFDIDLEMSKRVEEVEKEYTLPDGKVVTVHNQRYRCPETLFKPANIGMEASGIHKLCFNTIMKCDVDLRNSLYCNVMLSGGSSLFSGIGERMAKELINLVPEDSEVKVFTPPERMLSAWMGGSILSSLPGFQQLWITQEEFKEVGPNIVHRKCF
ncbi:actin-related protein T3 [Spea bombifrons]|uniref:actin-related protein T3 n=1 Tax=Spea bombifrons TaxID=233779 RepID=UPI00234AE007|nr:actin-related protein T3 [Spea bombifrons]